LLKYADVGGGVFFLNAGAHLPKYIVNPQNHSMEYSFLTVHL